MDLEGEKANIRYLLSGSRTLLDGSPSGLYARKAIADCLFVNVLLTHELHRALLQSHHSLLPAR